MTSMPNFKQEQKRAVSMTRMGLTRRRLWDEFVRKGMLARLSML